MKAYERLNALHEALLRRHQFATARDIGAIIDELRSEMPETGVRAAWAAVVDTLYEARPDWAETAGKSSMENAVAAIRSMAAQCSAQELQTLQAQLTPPAGVRPLRQSQIGALSYAIGYLEARDRGAVAVELNTLHAWLVANAPRT